MARRFECTVEVRLRLSEARPEGRVWPIRRFSICRRIPVSVRPAPKGGCGVEWEQSLELIEVSQ